MYRNTRQPSDLIAWLVVSGALFVIVVAFTSPLVTETGAGESLLHPSKHETDVKGISAARRVERRPRPAMLVGLHV